MITRLKRFKDKDTRKMIGVILAGKMTAVVILLGLMKGASWYFDSYAGAAVAQVHHADDRFRSHATPRNRTAG